MLRELASDDPNIRLAELAVESNHLSRQESDEALEAFHSGANGKNFGMFLVANNYLSPEALWELTRSRDQREKQAAGSGGNGAGNPHNGHGNGSDGNAPVAAVNPDTANFASQETRQNGLAREPAAADSPVSPAMAGRKGELLQYGPGTSLADLLEQAMALKASDLHIHSGAPLTVRLAGEIQQATPTALTGEECERLVLEALNENQRAVLEKEFQVDFAFEQSGVGRFRANAYRQQRGIDAVIRTIRPAPPTLEELGMPEELKRIAGFHQGLVLFTGPAGCGKSSTMAAVVSLINRSRSDHILTIEDPVEYVHPSASCNVNQREVGAQTESFPRALRAALREDPDVIVIGELRDLETVSMAITAAETGHLVLATLHTSNSVRTINRLLSVYPPEQQAQVRVMLSESLKAIISQRLVQRADGKGQVPAVEVLFNNNAIGNLIRDCKTHQIKSILQTGGGQGQRLLDASLAALLKAKAIKQSEALRHAEEPAKFQ